MIFGKGKRKDRNKYEQAIYDQLDIIKSRYEVGDELLDQFVHDKNTAEFQSVYTVNEPLVSVCIATYNRCELLLKRSIPSVLGQSYRNLELIVVGDGCTDATEQMINGFRDQRLSFINLERRGFYPDDPHLRWMVAGTAPVNRALEVARGQYITHLDDDDEFLPDRLERLVTFAREQRAHLVWHPFWAEKPDGSWSLRECPDFRSGMVTTSSVLYHQWFARIPWRIDAYKFHEPGDWNRFRKWKYLKADVCRYPEPLLRHYKERGQSV